VSTPSIDPLAYLGSGWQFPLTLQPDGVPGQVDHEAAVAQSIRIILGTDPGERLMRPTFGAGLSTFVFEPINPATMTRIRNQVRAALVDWEARIDVIDVRVTPEPERGLLTIDLEYRVRATNSLHNLVYPFYFDEGTAP
jgi:phage baseplate assembly protein W